VASGISTGGSLSQPPVEMVCPENMETRFKNSKTN